MLTTVGILFGLSLIPVIYALHGAWTMSHETTDVTRHRHKVAAVQKLAALARAAEQKLKLKRAGKR